MKWVAKLPGFVRFYLAVYITALLIFEIFRFAFLLFHYSLAPEVPFAVLLTSFLVGFRFDTVICCYILAVPFLISGILAIFKTKFRGANLIRWYLVIMFAVAFFICGADIPYFAQFNSRISFAALNWLDTPVIMLKVMFGDWLNYIYLLLFALVVWLLFRVIGKYSKFLTNKIQDGSILKNVIFLLIAGGLVFLGIRGRIEPKSPIRWGTAYFSEHAFANQLALNPVFTFVRTWIDFTKRDGGVALMDARQAIQNTRHYLGVTGPNDFSIDRTIEFDTIPSNYNIVLVLMESMPARLMEHHGNEEDLTPALDRLYDRSAYVFPGFYAAGTHTFNGVHSSLYGMPALMHINPMKSFEMKGMSTGLPIALRANGYKTIFLCPHDAQFDNLGGYLVANGFQKIISEKDFPREEVLTTFGVPDHVLFNKALTELDQLNNDGEPFFATILTSSNHTPIVIPEGIPFSSDYKEPRKQIVQYADWALGRFMEEAGSRPWFSNTIFLITGDHGKPVSPVYDLPLSYHHVPLLIYAPGVIAGHRAINRLGGQIDLFPTVMGLLQIDYTNSTMGIDLLREQREYIYFSADDKYACLSDSLLYIRHTNGISSLHHYLEKNTKDVQNDFPEQTRNMRRYAESMIQAAASLVSGN